MRLPKRRIFLVGSLVLFGSLAVGIAYAAIESGGVIQGCYDKGGNLKIVQALPCRLLCSHRDCVVLRQPHRRFPHHR